MFAYLWGQVREGHSEVLLMLKPAREARGAPVKRAGEKRMDRTVHTLFILGRSQARALLAYEFAI